jgi:hypothetical protein
MASQLTSVFRKYIFVLWGESFDEAIATIFITELRKAGLRVKLLCLSGQRAAGMHGLQLGCDVSLTQALPLVADTLCVVVPCSAGSLRRFANDPRLVDFLVDAQQHGARLIVGQGLDTETGLPGDPLLALTPEVCPSDEALIEFVRGLAQTFHGLAAP